MAKLTLQDMQEAAVERGGQCLSTQYIDSTVKLRWRCSRGHEWSARPSSIRAGTWCRLCAAQKIAAKKRIPLSVIQDMARKRGGRCLSAHYDGKKNDVLQWACAKGHIWLATLGKIRNDETWCPECAHANRLLTIDEMQRLAAKHGGACLSTKYRGVSAPLTWKCGEGHVFKKTPGDIRSNGTWCPRCSTYQRLTIGGMRALARLRGGLCLSKVYRDAHTKLLWQCSRGHQWEARPADVKNAGSWCPECGAAQRGAKQRDSMEDMRVLAGERGGQCLSATYEHSGQKLRWRCASGHEWEATPGNVRHSGSWCPECLIHRSEKACRSIFEALFRRPFPKARPSWLKNARGNQMELDGYCERLRLAFEYNGFQHYNKSRFFHGARAEAALRQRRVDDRRRMALCRDHGVRLLVIPYKVPLEAVEDRIREWAQGLSVTVPRRRRVRLGSQSLFVDDRLAGLQLTAEERCGRCLTAAYVSCLVKMRWQCAEGHTWLMNASAIRAGQWCPQCGVQRRAQAQMLSRDGFVMIAKAKGGALLSTEYLGLRARHRWRCKNGHEWSATAGNIKNGSWCPTCAGRTPKHT